MEKTYSIIGRTNGYIASRDANFNGKTEVVIEEGLSLKEAQRILLDMFNTDYDTYCANWGIARIKYPSYTSSYKDGTRSYEYDSRYYYIAEEVFEDDY